MSRQRLSALAVTVVGVLCLCPLPSASGAEDAGDPILDLLIPPVDALIERRFEPPTSPYGPGHRGVDYSVSAGTRVRAAGPGVVTWAGPVAGNVAVTIDHGQGLETTYSILSTVGVMEGEKIDEGRWIGTVEHAHDSADGGLHFGVKLDHVYVDPMDYLGPADLGDAIHLAPLVEAQTELPTELRLAHEGAGAAVRTCRDPAEIQSPPAPNDNVAIAIAGLSSSTLGGTDAAILEPSNGPRALGYPAQRVYHFSYRGTRGPHLHQPYGAPDTWRDVNESARRLRRLLIEIKKEHPGSDVDLFAHSQGGLVARAVVEHLARAYDARLPRVEHLVTYGTPHNGTTLADIPADLRGKTLTGRFVVDELAERGRQGRFPLDPEATSIDQMKPGSAFVTALANEDVSFGTRVLALAMPHDLIVPTSNALFPGEDSRVMSPGDINGHREVVASDQARSLAYAFLRGAPDSCPGNWDSWGPLLSRGVSFAHGVVADAYAEIETVGLAKAFRILKWASGKGQDALRWTGSQARKAAAWAGRHALSAGEKVVRGGRWAADRAGEVGDFLRSGIARLW